MKFERRCVAVAFALYLVFQLHATAFHGYWGQDWINHKHLVVLAEKDPWEFLTRYGPNRTNPPLYHLIGALLRRTVGPDRYIVAMGLLNVAMGAAGMGFAYAVIRRLIASPLLRIAALVFLLFLPVAMIHAQVVASDALATPLFWLLLWLVLGFRGDSSARSLAWRISVIAILLVAGILTKFTFGSFILATAVWARLLWRTRLISLRRLCLVLIVVTAVPALWAYRERVAFSKVTDPFAITVPERWHDAQMNPRSVVWLRPADVNVLSAPPYNWFRGGTHPLLASNTHSFPALMYLGTFTDVVNIYQYDPYDQYFGQRTERNHRRMKVAVRSGIVFALLAAAAVIVLFARSAVDVVVRGSPRDLPLLTMLLFCGAWFVNVVAALPLLPAAYAAGFWLPRLIAPALIGFSIAPFVLLDRARWMAPSGQAAVLAAVLAQSGLHASFLWPAPSEDAIHEYNDDVAAAAEAAGAVFRIVSWQDGYHANPYPFRCLERANAVVVDRGAGAGKGWTLRFDVAPGPSNILGRGTLRISSPLAAPATFDFAGPSTPVAMELPLARGRNEIRVELAAPAPAETPVDFRVCMAQITGLQVAGRDGARATLQPR